MRKLCASLTWPHDRRLRTPDLPHGPQGRPPPLGRALLSRSVFKHTVNAVNSGSNLRKLPSAVLCGLLVSKHLPASLAPTVSSRSENYTRCLRFSVQTPHTCALTHAHSHAHSDSSAQSNWAEEKGQKLCQERHMAERHKPQCRREGRQQHTWTYFVIHPPEALAAPKTAGLSL